MLWFDRAGMASDTYQSLASFAQTTRPRVLAWAPTGDGVVAALPDRLAIRRGGVWDQVWWHDIVSGGWDSRESALTWRTTDGESGRADVAEPGQLPDLFRERVTASIVVSEHVDVPGGRSVTISARRNPAAPRSAIMWVPVAGRGVDLANPAVKAVVDEALVRVQSDYDIGGKSC